MSHQDFDSAEESRQASKVGEGRDHDGSATLHVSLEVIQFPSTCDEAIKHDLILGRRYGKSEDRSYY